MASTSTTEAKDASTLRELGFTAIEKELSIAVRGAGLSRNQRRQLKKQRYRPWFTMSGVGTAATDETGQSWLGPPNTDLSSLGYENKTDEFEADLRTLRNKNERFN